MIAGGELSLALERLKTAAGNVSIDHADTRGLFERIHAAVDAVVAADPGCEAEAQAVREVVVRREEYIAERRSRPLTRDAASGVAPDAAEPWYYVIAEWIAYVAILASVVSLLGGIVIGAVASKYTDLDGQTQHHAGVVILGIVGGSLCAGAWLGVAAVLNLLLEIGRTLRSSSAPGRPVEGLD